MNLDLRSVSTRSATLLRIALVFLVAVAVWWVVTTLLTDVFASVLSARVSHLVRAVLLTVVVVPLIVAACRYLDHRPLRALGLSGPADGSRLLLIGMFGWLVPAGVGLVVAVSAGWLQVAVTAPTAGMLGILALRLLLVFCYEALPEELLFRGHLYRVLADRLAPWAAVCVQAGIFTLFGVLIADAASSVDRLILFVTFGLVLGAYRAVTGTLWACIGFHLAFQTVAQAHGAGELSFVAVSETTAGTFEVVVLWFFPIVLGGLLLAAGSAVRHLVGGRAHG